MFTRLFLPFSRRRCSRAATGYYANEHFTTRLKRSREKKVENLLANAIIKNTRTKVQSIKYITTDEIRTEFLADASDKYLDACQVNLEKLRQNLRNPNARNEDRLRQETDGVSTLFASLPTESSLDKTQNNLDIMRMMKDKERKARQVQVEREEAAWRKKAQEDAIERKSISN
ncbi:hypothetical protein MMC13_004315 [Lambiella insularis]|nr:hypothetical protein [Lambiella insularis]